MSVRARLFDLLKAGFSSGATISLEDVSSAHAGHAGAHPEGESHFNLVLVSSDFEGKSRLSRHRVINELLVSELGTRVHALSIKALTPQEVSGSVGEDLLSSP